MRTLALSLLISASTALSGIAQTGPRLLENRIVPRVPAAAAGGANIRVDVNMALIPVTVLDSTGHSVLGLTKESFRVFDGSEQRPIKSFGTHDAPVSVGIIFDCSGSMADKFRTARTAPAELFGQLNPEDEAFLITAADRAEVRQGFTSDFGEIQNALLFSQPKGNTSLLDAVFLGLETMKKAKNPRKALIVVSDGGDNNSRYSLRELTEIAAEADVQIYPMCLFDRPKTSEEEQGPDLLAKLAFSSGGLTRIVRSAEEMRGAMGQLGVALHNQYLIGYYPPEGAPGGKYRKVQVTLLLPQGLPRLRIFARNGYYTPDR
jgi:Ca-activated chloride channel homolog